jgi:hypothetical protein
MPHGVQHMTAKPLITHARLHEVLDYDPETGIFTNILWRPHAIVGRQAGYLDEAGYIRIGIDGTYYRAHRLAWFYVHGVWPPNQIDHINRRRDDNRIANLRKATQHENSRNCSVYKSNIRGLKGVRKHVGGRWEARIRYNKRLQYLGLFDKIEDALDAYAKATRELFGDFAPD